MAYPRKYSQDLIDSVVERVTEQRARRHHGAVTTVARELGLERRLVQAWVSEANRGAAHIPAPPLGSPPMSHLPGDVTVVLPPGLLHCQRCAQLMSSVVGVTGTLVYQCLPDCRCRPLPAGILVDTIGRAVLRIAPQLVDSSTGAKTPEAAASHADRVFTRITAGKNATDLHFAWCSISTAQPGQPAAEAVRHARKLADTDLFHAREVLRRTLAAVDPATADAHHGHADAANLYAEILIRLGNPAAATSWAAYAQHSFARLNGPAALRTLTAMHLRATAHRLCGHYQRAYHLYLNLSETLRISAGSDAHPALAAQANLAVVLHALGHCVRARTLLADTITLHRRAHPGHPATEKMVGHLARIWQYCADQRHQHVET